MLHMQGKRGQPANRQNVRRRRNRHARTVCRPPRRRRRRPPRRSHRRRSAAPATMATPRSLPRHRRRRVLPGARRIEQRSESDLLELPGAHRLPPLVTHPARTRRHPRWIRRPATTGSTTSTRCPMTCRVCTVVGCPNLIDAGARGGRCAVHRAEARRARGDPPGRYEHAQVRARLLRDAVGHPCPSCGDLIVAERADLDHALPRALGGSGPGDRILCARCNRARGGRLGARLRRDGGLC